MFAKICLMTSLFFMLIFITQSKLVLKLNKMICTPNPRRIINASCSVKPFNRYYKIGNLRAFLLKPSYIQFNLKLFRRTNGWQPFLLNIHDDLCRFLSTGKTLPFIDTFYNITLKYTNLNHSCPYQGYIIGKDINVNATEILPIFPAGRYLTTMTFRDGKENLGVIDSYFTAEEFYNKN